MENIKKITAVLLSPFMFLGNLFAFWIYTAWPAKEYSSVPWPEVPCPAVETAFDSLEDARENGGGWYVTMDEQFEGDTLPARWKPSPHGKRNTEYWCTNMLDPSVDGRMRILAAMLDDNVCDTCPAQGDFTSGIETPGLFEQAFGYYECRVKYPLGPGLWSAFWLQTYSMGNLGARGKDGAEIDIYESAFHYDPTKVGNCVHWDGYGDFHGSTGYVTDTGADQYDGWHTYGLLWTPKSYTFFVDGKATWQTNSGGVSRVPEHLRLTVEIRRTEFGPYGAKLGEFANTRANPSVFEIDYVKVYQHTDFLQSIRRPSDFINIKYPWYYK